MMIVRILMIKIKNNIDNNTDNNYDDIGNDDDDNGNKDTWSKGNT